MRFRSVAWLLFGIAPAGLSAQGAEPTQLRGIVLDSKSSLPVADAEVSSFELKRTTQSGMDGRFGLRDLKPGSYLLQVRRIGYEPQLVRVVVSVSGERVDTIFLLPHAVELAELSVEARLPPPSFFLRVESPVDQRIMSVSLRANYMSWGAAMADEMQALIFLKAPRDTTTYFAERVWYHELSSWSWLFGGRVPCRDRTPGPIAAQVSESGPTYLGLYADGLVQRIIPLDRRRLESCIPLYRLPRDLQPMHAAGSGGWWIVTTVGADSAPTGVGLLGEKIRWRLDLSKWLAPGDIPQALVSARGGLFTIASSRWPFPWIAVDTSGTIRATGGVSELTRYASAETFPVLPIERGFIQTLVGATGSPRTNVLYDNLGRFVRLEEGLGIPLFLSSAPTLRRLLGVHLMPNKERVGALNEYAY